MHTGFAFSTEAQNDVIGFYQTILGRTPGPSEVSGWENALNGGTSLAQVHTGFAFSTEAQNDIIGLYKTILGVTPSPNEVSYWENAFNNGTSLAQVRTEFSLDASQSIMLNSSDIQYVEAGNTAGGTVVNGGSYQVVQAGGVVSGAVVDSGSYQAVEAGGTASGTTLNGGSEIVETGGTANGTITFTGSGQLTLDQSTGTNNFQLVGFNAPSEKLDLADISYGAKTTIAFSEASSGQSGTLTVSDGTHTADITLDGQYIAQNFTLASDGRGGTIVYDPPVSGQPTSPGPTANDASSEMASNGWMKHAADLDSFVFVPNLGQVAVANFGAERDTIHSDWTAFANGEWVATHDAANGVAVPDAHETLTIQGNTAAQTHVHQSDFHIV